MRYFTLTPEHIQGCDHVVTDQESQPATVLSHHGGLILRFIQFCSLFFPTDCLPPGFFPNQLWLHPGSWISMPSTLCCILGLTPSLCSSFFQCLRMGAATDYQGICLLPPVVFIPFLPIQPQALHLFRIASVFSPQCSFLPQAPVCFPLQLARLTCQQWYFPGIL